MTSQNLIFTHRRDSLGGRLAVSRTQSSPGYPFGHKLIFYLNWGFQFLE